MRWEREWEREWGEVGAQRGGQTHTDSGTDTEEQTATTGREGRERIRVCQTQERRREVGGGGGGGWRARRNIKAIIPLVNCKPRGPGQRPAASRNQSEDQFRDSGGVQNILPRLLSIWNAFLPLYLLASKGSFRAHPKWQLLWKLYWSLPPLPHT